MSKYSEALAWAASYCSASEHCQSEVREKLKRFELDAMESQKVLERLQTEGFLNESRFAKAFVNDKFRYNQWGRAKIRYMLRMKGVTDSVIGEALESIDPDLYEETLRKLLLQKRKGMKGSDSYVEYAKLMRFASGKGFEPSVIARCLRELGLNDED